MSDILIYGKKYRCYREGRYIGVHLYANDPNIGDCFLSETNDGVEVAIPDKWLFLRIESVNDLLAMHNVRIENEVETGDIWLTYIDRNIYPRLWKDNDADNRMSKIATSSEAETELMNPFLEKDWFVRFCGNSIEDVIEQFQTYLDNNS